MAETKRGTKRRGFHALERKIHNLEEADRTRERKRDARPNTSAEEREVTPDVRPPSAHDE